MFSPGSRQWLRSTPSYLLIAVVALMPVVAAVIASTSVHLLGLAINACAACVDPSAAMPAVGFAGGLAGAGAAAAGTLGTGLPTETGGSGVGRDDRTIIPPTGPAVAGDASRRDWGRGQFGPPPSDFERGMLHATDVAETWAKKMIPYMPIAGDLFEADAKYGDRVDGAPPHV